MSFADSLRRLRAAATETRGRERAIVDCLDLRELLRHFDRLDAQVRAGEPLNDAERAELEDLRFRMEGLRK
jgi:hypothetical protein